MDLVNGWNNSLFKVLSSKKSSDNRAAIRRKLERIRHKLRSGARLTPAEKEFLRRYAPQLYEQAMSIERERAAYEERLKKCQTEEEMERVQLEKMAEIAAAAKEEVVETVLVRIAQMEAAEKEAIKESQAASEELEEDIQEEFNEEFWNIEEAEKVDLYEDIIEPEFYQEDYEETGIYSRPLYKEADRDSIENDKQPLGRFISLQKQEAAFVRGHAAYRRTAEAEYELDIWETNTIKERIAEDQAKKQKT